MATAPRTTTLKTAIRTYSYTKGLKDGTVTVPGIQFEHIEINPIIGAFRRMCRGLEFDVAEMAITTYLTARAYNKPFTALPVFVLRQFHHAPMVYNVNSGVKAPRDLEGKKVGVRAYTVTTGVWARGILATEYGVDLSKVTWVLADEEHVEEYHRAYPANVVYQAGANLAEMLARGEFAAAIGVGRVDSRTSNPSFPMPARQRRPGTRRRAFIPSTTRWWSKTRCCRQTPPWHHGCATLLQRRRQRFYGNCTTPPSPARTRPWRSCAAW